MNLKKIIFEFIKLFLICKLQYDYVLIQDIAGDYIKIPINNY